MHEGLAMPYRVNAVVPAFYRSQTRSATAAISAYHKRYATDAIKHEERWLMVHMDDPDYNDIGLLSRSRCRQCKRIDPTLLPKRLYLSIDKLPYLDFYEPSRAGGAYVVSGRLQAMIERHEPSVHQFVPVELIARDGSPLGLPYFFLINQQARFGLLWKQSSGISVDTSRPFALIKYVHHALQMTKTTFDIEHNIGLAPTIKLDARLVGGLALWREVTPLRVGADVVYNDEFGLFMSDELFIEIMRGGLQGIAATHKAELVADGSGQSARSA